ncbi:phosphate/phosphite/phosphonate ABC transporter substrate-binding protein [Polaromonas sp. YR568]|uniref:phosphate/phosphite/phosphonate ABC transporter substrate-binding protein n=1 Tax=Polaromonas sp. YR568 TaxID=1855301 RepID=UPI00398C0B8B
MSFRQCVSVLLLALMAGQAWAQGTPLVFAVNEGVTYRVNPGATVERFRELSEDLGKLLKRPVKIQPVTDYKELAAGLAEQRYDIAYVHPAHHSIRAMSKSGYHLIALTKGFTEYRDSFMVRSDSPLKTLADLKGHKIGAPDEDSITSVIMRATLRDALGAQPLETSYVKLQEAVPFMVEHGLVTAGVTASRAVVKDWQDKGGKVLATSKPVPIKHMIASAKVTDAQRAQLTAYFVGLEQSAEGKKRLEALNVTGFVEFDEAALVGIGKWLGL